MNYFYLYLFCLTGAVTLLGQEKKIIIVSCFYNVAPTITRTLDSLFSQTYYNMHIILVDDGSTDNTANLIKEYLNNNQNTTSYTLITNPERKRKLYNLYTVIHACDPESIILLVDGDDWLKHSGVLSYLNKMYQDESVWMTYGEYENLPKNTAQFWGVQEKSYCAPLHSSKDYRHKPFIFMHPRSFYAWLFHSIPVSDLMCETIPGFQGNFFPAGNDMAIFFPMAELAGEHIRYNKELLYCRNVASPLVGFKVDHDLQQKAGEELRKKRPKVPLREKRSPLCLAENDIAIFQIDTAKKIQQSRYVVYQSASSKKKYDKKIWVTIADHIEKTGALFCMVGQKPKRAIPIFQNLHGIFYAWKPALIKHIPVCESIIIKTQVLKDLMKQSDVSINDTIIHFLQSKKYDVGLSFIPD